MKILLIILLFAVTAAGQTVQQNATLGIAAVYLQMNPAASINSMF